MSLYVNDVLSLRRSGDLDGARALLERIVDQLFTGAPDVPPWFIEQLAIIYRLTGRAAEEVVLLERFVAVAAPTRRGVKLRQRLERIRPLPG